VRPLQDLFVDNETDEMSGGSGDSVTLVEMNQMCS
jgi:hypothetical protein